MKEKKLIAIRGEEPTLLPGSSQEVWRQIEFGIGAAATPSDMRVKVDDSHRKRPMARIGKLLIYGFLVLTGCSVISALIFNLVG